MRTISLILVALLAAAPARAELFKCQAAGRTVYQDAPCASGGGQKLAIQSRRPAASEPVKFTGPVTADRCMAEFALDSTEWWRCMGVKIDSSTLVKKRALPEGEGCLDKHRNLFRDPRSAYVVDSWVFRDNQAAEDWVSVEVSARNGFGGNTKNKLICSL